ncbi:MAG: pseudouridine synthase [Kiritimatiellae bacterium]|jgi:23S rRNA pseudouridine2605 synthase|nr:pseudouridine synthase [Kiritimatiellia bacterium]
MSEEDNTIRLQKYLAQRGVGSRRKCAEIIASGDVRVNGDIVREAGYRVDKESDVVQLSGHAVKEEQEKKRVIAMYKPRGYLCTASNSQGKSVLSLLKGVKERVVPAGRLDKDSEGLLILSNDGDLINQITHPSHGHTKVYLVTVAGREGVNVIEELRQPIVIDGNKTRPAIVKFEGRKGPPKPKSTKKVPKYISKKFEPTTYVLRVILGEGRKHQIRELCKRSKLNVLELKRIQINDVKLEDLKLKPGEWKDIEL